MDTSGKNGPIEQSLIGTPVKNIDEPVDVLPVIHSFDPCLSCAAHGMRPAEGAKIFALGNSHGMEEMHMHRPRGSKGRAPRGPAEKNSHGA
jgi:hydrogenase large subunit